MKKKKGVLIAAALAVLAVVYFVAWSQNFYTTDEELLALVRRDKQVSESCPLHMVGDYYNEETNRRLFCVAAQNGAENASFYAVELEEHNGGYRSPHYLTPVTRGTDEYVALWGLGYVFMSGNPENKSIRLSFESAPGDVLIPVPQVPFACYYDLSGHEGDSMEYAFLNEDAASLQVSVGPEVYSSLEEFYAGVEAARSGAPDGTGPRSDDNALSELSFYYGPAWLPDDALLYSVRVKERYVALYYKVGEPAQSGDAPYGIEELTSTAMFEWTRIPEGEQLLKAQRQAEELTLLDGDAAKPVYYSEVAWYEDPTNLIGRQYYWTEDGYLFSMYLPNSELNDSLTFGVEQVPLGEREQAPAIELPLPYPSSQIFGLEGVDAVLYDAAVDYYSWRGGEDEDGLLMPSLAVIDSYAEGGNTCYICWFRQFDYYGLGYGLGDLNDPQYVSSHGRTLARFTVTTNAAGELRCTEIEEAGDGEGWAVSIRKLCGPRTALAEAIINNGAIKVDGTRDITTADHKEMLRVYLDYYFT